MKLIGKDTNTQPCVATIGSFDGVHLGHQFVVRQVMEQAQQRGLASLIVSFPNHPLKVLQSEFKPQLLSLAEEKVELLSKTGVDSIALIEFTKELSALTAFEFMQKILKEQLNVKVLIIGYDHHFGHDRKSFADYVEYGKLLDIDVIQNEELDAEFKASSTIVRNALNEGDIDTANKVLGYPYYIKGKVVSGFHIGRKIGFPTANIEVDEDKLVPMNGVYCVRVKERVDGLGRLEGLERLEGLDGLEEGGRLGMMNIGYRPTLDNGPQRSIEVHIFDFEEDLYDQELKIEFIKFLRPEQKFDSIEALIKQLEQDKRRCIGSTV